MDLFFSRDCAEGGGPTVELPSPLLDASDVAVLFAAAAVGATFEEADGWAVEVEGWVVVPVGLLKSEGAGTFVDAGVELAGVLPPPKLGNIDEPVLKVAEVPAPAVEVGAEDAAVVEEDVAPPRLGMLNPPELPPPRALDPVFADANKPFGASVAAGTVLLSVFNGCATWGDAGVVPILKAGGLLAGVAEGVVLPMFPNKDVFGVTCVPWPDWAAPPNRPELDGAEDNGAEMFFLASAGAALLPNPLKRPEPPELVPNGFAALKLGTPGLNILGVEDVEGAACFGANSDDDPVFVPPWDDWALNRLLPGGGPAGVVEGRENVLFGAGVAAGVADPIYVGLALSWAWAVFLELECCTNLEYFQMKKTEWRSQEFLRLMHQY
jgi:hypothetical protein